MFIGIIVSYDRVDARNSIAQTVTALGSTKDDAISHLLDFIKDDFKFSFKEGRNVYLCCGGWKHMDELGYDDTLVAAGEVDTLNRARELFGVVDEIVLTDDGYCYSHYKIEQIKES